MEKDHEAATVTTAGGVLRSPRILVLEDQDSIRGMVLAMLRIRSLECDEASSVAEAREKMARTRYDLLFIDVELPDGSGLSLMEDGRAQGALFVVVTARSDVATAVEAMRRGAMDFISKPFSVGHFLQRVDRALDEWGAHVRLQGRARALQTLARLKSEELSRTTRQVDEVHDRTVQALGAALDLKDSETAGHCGRVAHNSVRLGALLGLSAPELKTLWRGAYLHDVGKIGVPESILLKPGPLTPEERRTIERHPTMGYDLIRGIEFLGPATGVVLSHHERYDGAGYPDGLRGEGIPLHARIFSIMDTLDAMTSDRPYRAALPVSTASGEVQRLAGSQFDPRVVEVFLSVPDSTWLVQGRATVQN